jgi:hypothetical protein
MKKLPRITEADVDVVFGVACLVAVVWFMLRFM